MKTTCKLLFAFITLLNTIGYAQRLIIKPTTNNLLLQKIDKNFVSHSEYNQYALALNVENIELIQLRTENSKTFYGVDGQYRVQQTGGVFHYKDQNNQWITLQEHATTNGNEYGIFQSELPLKINTVDGLTSMQLQKNGGNYEFGKKVSLDYIDKNGSLVKSVFGTFNNAQTSNNKVIFSNAFSGIDRYQQINYWDLTTDYIIKQKLELPDNVETIQFNDRIRMPEDWSIEFGVGQHTKYGWEGSLLIKDENGNVLSEISMPKFYDSSIKKSKMESGHAINGTYKIKKLCTNTYNIQLVVPAKWLNSPNLVYPLIIDPTATNTYASNQALQDKNTTFSASCQATMNVTMIATPYQVTGTNTSYKIWAKGYMGYVADIFGNTDVYADKAEQRSKVGSLNGWTAVQAGVGTNHTGPWTVANNSMDYNLTNQTIANGCYSSQPTLPFYWQGYQTFLPYDTGGGSGNIYTAGCVTDYQELVTNTWIVTVTYTPTADITLSNFNVGACSNNLYDLSGTVNITNPPATGNLIATTCDGTQVTVASAPFSLGSYPLTMTGLNANGQACDVELYFSVGACSQVLTQTYTAPSCTTPTCSFSSMTASTTGCDPGNTYTVSGTLTFANAPTTGQLIVTDCSGNTQTFNAPFTSPQNYSISSLTPNGQSCTITAAFTDDAACTINQSYTTPTIPTVNAGNDVTICSGSSTTLTASGASNYVWDNNAGNTASVTVSPSSTTTYIVTATSTGCTATDQVTVTVAPSLNVTTTGDVTICPGSTATITASGATNYSWNNNAGSSATINVSPASTTTYIVTGTDANGCSGQAQATVTVANSLTLNATNVSMCEGGNSTITVSGAGTNGTYTWQPATYLSSATGNTVTFTAGATTTYTITGTDANGCTGTTTVTATVNLNPTIDAGVDKIVCTGSNVTLTASGAGSNGTYTWDNNVVNGSAFIPPVGTTTYTVTGTTSNGCSATDQVTVTVEDTPQISFTATQDQNCSPVTATFTNTSANANNCVWTFSNGQTITNCGPITQTYNNAGYYGATLQITSPTGCVATLHQDSLVYVEAKPVASFVPSPVIFELSNPQVTFTNHSTGATSYLWDFDDNGATSTQEHPFHKYPETPAAYTVTLYAYSASGCMDSTTYFVKAEEDLLFYIPNTFTPDGDEFNNVFQPVFTSGFDPFDFNMLIFNRWGERVFESKDATIGWDGIFGGTGKMCQDGTYIWKIEFKTLKNDERKTYTGHVNVMR
ncbi:MAG: gliding motility-associated C-terminal domain-containing protein [Crocinitomicaceae bacterium]